MYSIKRFEDFPLSPEILKGIEDLDFEMVFPIQAQAIIPLLKGKDVIGQARTGTGKTAAFGIPMLENIEQTEKHVQGLVLVPTRELAIQVADHINNFGKYTSLKTIPIYGGTSIRNQISALKRGVQIIVGTPGRIIDHIQRRTLRLHTVRIVVLDEADRMLDMGFKDDIDFILEQVPTERQLSLFSATIDNFVIDISHQYMSNPEKILASRDEIALPQITQLYTIVNPYDKINALNRIIETEKIERAIIFCRTRIRSTKLAAKLHHYGHNAEAIHGGLSQAQRETIINAFRNHQINLLTATDVIARGIDIEDITHILNYDVPLDSKVYFHRIGRTARVGKEGIAITLVGYNEISEFDKIRALTKTSFEEMEIDSRMVFQRRRSKNSNNRSVPVRLGKKYEADIIKRSRKGDGIVKIEGFVIFIPNTKIGDRVRFKINRIGRSYATAEVI